MLTGNGLDGSFEQHAVVTSQDRIVDMVQVDFELPGCELGGGRSCRNVLLLAGRMQVSEEFVDVPQVVGVVDLRPRVAVGPAPAP